MFKKLIEDVTKQSSSDDSSWKSRQRTGSTSSKASEAKDLGCQPTATTTGPSTIECSVADDLDYKEDSDDVVSISSSVLHPGPDVHELQVQFQRVHRLARTYKTKFQQLTERHKSLASERDRLEELLTTSQTKSSRQVQELLEQSQLDRKAKEDLDSTCQRLLHEKDDLLVAMRLEISKLKEENGNREAEQQDTAEAVVHRHETEALKNKENLEAENRDLLSKIKQLEGELVVQKAKIISLQQHHNQQEEESQRERQAVAGSHGGESLLLRHQLTDSELARSALEEQVSLLKVQLSGMLSASDGNGSDLQRQLKTIGDQLAREQDQRLALQEELAVLRSSTASGQRSEAVVEKTEALEALSQLHRQLDAILEVNCPEPSGSHHDNADHSSSESAGDFFLSAHALGFKMNKLVDSLVLTRQDLDRQAAEHRLELDKLMASQEQLQDHLTSLTGANASTLADLQSTGEQLDRTQRELTVLREEAVVAAVQHRDRVDALTGRLKARSTLVVDQLTGLKHQVGEWRRQLTELRGAHESSIKLLRSQLEGAVGEPLLRLHSTCLSLVEENGKLAAQNSCLKEEVEGHRKQFAQVHDNSQSVIADLEDQLRQLQSRLVPEATVAGLRGQESITDGNDPLSAVRELCDFQSECTARVDELAGRADTVSRRLDQLTVLLKKTFLPRLVKSENAALAFRNEAAELWSSRSKEIACLRQDLAGRDSRIDELKDLVEQMTSGMTDKKAKPGDAELRLQELTDKLNRVVRQHFSHFDQLLLDLASRQGEMEDLLNNNLSLIQPYLDYTQTMSLADGTAEPEDAVSIIERMGGEVIPQLLTTSIEIGRGTIMHKLEKALLTVEEHRNEVQRLVCERDSLKEEISRHLRSLQRLEDEVEELETRLDQLMSELKDSRATAKAASHQRDAIILELQGDLDELKQDSAETSERHWLEMRDTTAELDRLREAYKSRSAELTRLTETGEQTALLHQTQLSDMQQEIDKLQTALASKTGDLDDLRQSVDRLSAVHAECPPPGRLDEALAQRDAQIAQLTEQMTAARLTQAELGSANEALKLQLEQNLQAAKTHFDSQREAHSREVEQLNRRLHQLEVDHQLALQGHSREVSELKTLAEAKQQQLDSERSSLADLQTAYQLEQEKAGTLASALESLRLSLTDIETEETGIQQNARESEEQQVDELRKELADWKTRCQELSQKFDTVAAASSSGGKTDSLERQLRQQLKEVRQRLKQVLQESETLRKSSVSATALASDVEARLSQSERQLTEATLECDQLRQQVDHLTHQLRQVSLSDTRACEEKELYQKELESLKEEHALHAHEMRRQMEEELLNREQEIRGESESQLNSFRRDLERSLGKQAEALTHALGVSQAEVELLRSEVDRLNCLHELELTRKTETADKSCLTVESSCSLALSPPPRQDSFEVMTALTTSRTTHSASRSSSKAEIGSARWSQDSETIANQKPAHWMDQLRNQIVNSSGLERSDQLSYGDTVSAEDYEALRLHNADLQNQLHQFTADFQSLCSQCVACRMESVPMATAVQTPRLALNDRRQPNQDLAVGGLARPPAAPSHSGAMGQPEGVGQMESPSYPQDLVSVDGVLHEMVEYEYLKNVLFQYMIGCETQVLSKVLCSIMRFDQDQVNQIMHVEYKKQRTWSIQQVIE